MPSRNSERAGPVVVCGAGAAGMAAALAAARAGADVQLIEAGPRIGGTVAEALIHTLGGLYDSSGELLNDGLPRELVERLTQANGSVHPRRMGRAWVLNVCPDVYRDVVERWLAADPRITVCRQTRVIEVTVHDACAVPHPDERPSLAASSRVGELSTAGGQPGLPRDECHAARRRLRPRAVVDATGTGELVRLIDPALVEDAPGRAAGGLIFRMRGVAAGALAFPRGIGVVRALRSAAEAGELPAECGKAWIDSGIHADEVFVKLFVPLPDDWRDCERGGGITRRALETQRAVASFLKRMPEFAEARVTRTGTLGVRDGGRIRGEYLLTAADVREGRQFEDPACRCAWPIEYWDPEQGVSLEYLSENRYYEVPLRALKVQGLENVWAAGKCLSADRLAQASARVAGTCWAMGEAAGTAAANAR